VIAYTARQGDIVLGCFGPLDGDLKPDNEQALALLADDEVLTMPHEHIFVADAWWGPEASNHTPLFLLNNSSPTGPHGFLVHGFLSGSVLNTLGACFSSASSLFRVALPRSGASHQSFHPIVRDQGLANLSSPETLRRESSTSAPTPPTMCRLLRGFAFISGAACLRL